MNAEWMGLFLAKPVSPGNSVDHNLGVILSIGLALIIILPCVIVLFASYRRNRVCPRCQAKTVLGWHTEKIDARRKWVRFGGKWHYGGVLIQKTAVIRCPACGWEINLGE